jgi:hypothetical protein
MTNLKDLINLTLGKEPTSEVASSPTFNVLDHIRQSLGITKRTVELADTTVKVEVSNDQKVFKNEDFEALVSVLPRFIKAPYVKPYMMKVPFNPLIKEDISILFIDVSLDSPKTWKNNKIANSRYFRFQFNQDGRLQRITPTNSLIRLGKCQSEADIIKKINKILSIENTGSEQASEASAYDSKKSSYLEASQIVEAYIKVKHLKGDPRELLERCNKFLAGVDEEYKAIDKAFKGSKMLTSQLDLYDKSVNKVQNVQKNLIKMLKSSEQAYAVDKVEDLGIYVENTASLYPQLLNIIKSLSVKKKKGIYNKDKAIIFYTPLVENACKMYVKEFDISIPWNRYFTKEVRNKVAVYLEETYKEELASARGELASEKVIFSKKDLHKLGQMIKDDYPSLKVQLLQEKTKEYGLMAIGVANDKKVFLVLDEYGELTLKINGIKIDRKGMILHKIEDNFNLIKKIIENTGEKASNSKYKFNANPSYYFNNISYDGYIFSDFYIGKSPNNPGYLIFGRNSDKWNGKYISIVAYKKRGKARNYNGEVNIGWSTKKEAQAILDHIKGKYEKASLSELSAMNRNWYDSPKHVANLLFDYLCAKQENKDLDASLVS